MSRAPPAKRSFSRSFLFCSWSASVRSPSSLPKSMPHRNEDAMENRPKRSHRDRALDTKAA